MEHYHYDGTEKMTLPWPSSKKWNRVALPLLNVSLLPTAALLFFLKYAFNLHFHRVNSSRIGHLAHDNEVFLRKRRLGMIKKGAVYIGIAAHGVCNQALLRILQRQMTIWQIPQTRLWRSFTKIVATQSILSRWKLFYVFPSTFNALAEYNHLEPSLSFIPEEEQQGQELLETMGIRNWFICFHSRDSLHLAKFLKKGDRKHDFRNSRIEQYLPAAGYIALRGGYALRMGATVEQELPKDKPHRVIDYAFQYRTEFGDIFLPAKCKFFLGSTSGIANISYIFNVPVAHANFVPITNPFPPGNKDLFIPKKIWSAKEKRFLTFREMLDSPIINSWQFRQFREEDGLIPMDNTAEEILELAREMNERLDGTWESTPEDEALQHKFKAVWTPDLPQHRSSCRLGADFLRKNKYLLD